jgi:general secretion pathway protein E
MSYTNLDNVDINYTLSLNIPYYLLEQYMVLPLYETNNFYVLTCLDPNDIDMQEQIQRFFDTKTIKYVQSEKKQISIYLHQYKEQDKLKKLLAKIKTEMNGLIKHTSIDQNTSILELIDIILKRAIRNKSSDIHIEPTPTYALLRVRIDGLLKELYNFEYDIYLPLISRIKLLASLDIAQKKQSQDGRFSYIVDDASYDFRISTLSTIHGESIVIRILNKDQELLDLNKAGMNAKSLSLFLQSLRQPNGLVLITGPTGSGKSTTLYGAINEIKDINHKIITIEDPVEYTINLIQQVNVSKELGLNFSNALRSILRQDPDTIMIGEIRDKETLQIAIESALTGHLVLSTLHTNNALSTITRLIDMGLEPYLLSGALRCIVSQKLIRKICTNCKTKATIIPALPSTIKIDKNDTFYTGGGCKECEFTGYKGREIICESLIIDDKLARLIASNESSQKIEEQAINNGFVSIKENALLKAKQSITSLEEVLRMSFQ